MQPAACAAEPAAPLYHFSKTVPATSTAPIFKFVLPSEIVTATLQHLLGKEFELVAAGRQRSWPVSILPRKNKGKHEFMIQGWRAFAEEQELQAGDLLHFTLAAERQLRVSVSRRPEVTAATTDQHATAPAGLPEDGSGALLLDDELRLRELGLLLEEDASGSGAESSALEPLSRLLGFECDAVRQHGREPPPQRCLSPQASMQAAKRPTFSPPLGPDSPPAEHYQLQQDPLRKRRAAEAPCASHPKRACVAAPSFGDGSPTSQLQGSTGTADQRAAGLDAALARASHAEARVLALERELSSLRGEVLYASLCGVAQTHALHGVAAGLPAAGPQAGALTGRLRSATAGITDTLWHLHRLGQDRATPPGY